MSKEEKKNLAVNVARTVFVIAALIGIPVIMTIGMFNAAANEATYRSGFGAGATTTDAGLADGSHSSIMGN